MTREEYILPYWTGEADDFREYINSPHKQGEYVYATCGRAVIRVHQSKVEKDYPAIEEPDMAAVFAETPSFSPAYISRKELEELNDRIPMCREETCKACGGDGCVDFTFEYDGHEYTSQNTCPVCGGEKRIPTLHPVKDDRWCVHLDMIGGPIRQQYFDQLLHTVTTLGLDGITITNASPFKYEFRLSDTVQCVIMCCINPENLGGETVKYQRNVEG